MLKEIRNKRIVLVICSDVKSIDNLINKAVRKVPENEEILLLYMVQVLGLIPLRDAEKYIDVDKKSIMNAMSKVPENININCSIKYCVLKSSDFWVSSTPS